MHNTRVFLKSCVSPRSSRTTSLASSLSSRVHPLLLLHSVFRPRHLRIAGAAQAETLRQCAEFLSAQKRKFNLGAFRAFLEAAAPSHSLSDRRIQELFEEVCVGLVLSVLSRCAAVRLT